MKVKCIDNDPMWKTKLETDDMMLDDINSILTVGKTYYVSTTSEYGTVIDSQKDYLIEHDKGGKRWFSSNRFITLDKWREEQLNELGIKEEDSN